MSRFYHRCPAEKKHAIKLEQCDTVELALRCAHVDWYLIEISEYYMVSLCEKPVYNNILWLRPQNACFKCFSRQHDDLVHQSANRLFKAYKEGSGVF